MSRALVFVATAFLLASTALHARKTDEKVVVADTPEKFEVLVADLHQEMAPGKRYEFLSPSHRSEVDNLLDRMGAMLVKSGGVDAMTPEEKANLFSDQEKVNGILARNADDRLICRHEAPVGSHIPVTTCHTVREIALSRRSHRDQMNDIFNKQRQVDANTLSNFTESGGGRSN